MRFATINCKPKSSAERASQQPATFETANDTTDDDAMILIEKEDDDEQPRRVRADSTADPPGIIEDRP